MANVDLKESIGLRLFCLVKLGLFTTHLEIHVIMDTNRGFVAGPLLLRVFVNGSL